MILGSQHGAPERGRPCPCDPVPAWLAFRLLPAPPPYTSHSPLAKCSRRPLELREEDRPVCCTRTTLVWIHVFCCILNTSANLWLRPVCCPAPCPPKYSWEWPAHLTSQQIQNPRICPPSDALGSSMASCSPAHSFFCINTTVSLIFSKQRCMLVTAVSSSAEASLQNQKNPTLNQHHRGPGWCLCGASHHLQAISSTPAAPATLHIPGPWTISFFLLPEHSTYISLLEGSLLSFFSSSFGSELQCSNDVICLSVLLLLLFRR